MRDYIHRILIALDQLLNTVIGGYPDETLSSRAYRRYLNGHKLQARLVNMIMFDRTHCKRAYENELNRTQYPNYYRGIK